MEKLTKRGCYILNSVNGHSKKVFFTSLFLFIGLISVKAQLSDLHYLPPLKQYSSNEAIQAQSIYLSTPEATGFTVRIYQGTNPIPIKTYTNLSSTNHEEYVLSSISQSGDNNITLVSNANTGVVLANSGLRIESENGEKFYVNYRGRSSFQAASLTSKGRSAFGKKFRWGGMPLYSSTKSEMSATLGIMATKDSTQITISGYDTNCVFRKGSDISGITDDTIVKTLQKGESFVLEAKVDATKANRDGWIGAKIESNQDIVISNGGLLCQILNGSPSRDAGIDQAVPEERLGKDYVLVRGYGTNGLERPIIIATVDNTDIYIGGVLIHTIQNKGEFYLVPGRYYSGTSAGDNMYINTTEPVYVYQALSGRAETQGGLNFIAPVNCLMPDTLDNIPNIRDVVDVNYSAGITIVSSSAIPDSDVKVYQNGSLVNMGSSKSVVGSSDWRTFFKAGLSGDVKVESTGPISVGFIAESGSAGIAGYFSGFDTAPPTDTVCSNVALNHDLTADVTLSGTTFSWAAADNANVTGETTTASALRSITDTLVNTSNSVQTVIYTITPTSGNGCTGDAYTYTVTIDPQDFVTTDLATHICNNETLNHDLTGDTTVPGTTFSWAAADNANVTGETTTASALRSITDTLVNTSNSVQTVIYTITPTSRNGCTGDAYTYTVTIDPQDFVTTDLATHICNNETLNHDLTGDTTVPGTTFSWAAADNANVTGETTTASALRSITDTLVNTSNSVQTVIYTITPTSRNGCTGDAYTYTVTIDPQDFVTTDLATHICNNETLNHDLTGDTTVPGTTFSWAAADNANVTGETTTASALRSITDTLVNTSNSVQTVIYTITPTSRNGCTGDAYTYTVTIDPQDFVTTDLATHICNNETLNHDLTGDTTVPGTTFSWAAADNANVTGETTTASALRSITDTLVNTSNSVQTVIYTITPTSRNGCTGDAYTYTVTIDPQDFVTTDLATHICNNETLNHDLTGDTTVPGTTFSWAAADNANVTGETTTASALRSITDTLVNTSNSVQTVIYTITPTSGNGCKGDAYTYTVTIDPQDFVTTDLATHICNNETLNHDLTGDTTVPGTTFSWAAADNANVTGETTTASALRSITDTLVNTSNSVQTVIYTITPTSRNGCTGDAYTYTVTIDPQDFVTTDLATHICNNETLNHDLTGDTTVPGTTFSWAAADNANVTGETTTASALRSITDTLVNTSNSVQTVIYTITPTSGNGCTGDAYTYTVTIDPQDFVTTDLATHICNNETLNHDLTGDTTVPGTTFSWAAADNANVTGETTTASALRSITDTLVNTSNSVQTVIYTITPTSRNGCTGDAYTYTVTIDPQDFVTTDLATHICNNETLNHDLTGDTTVPGTTFSWAAADNANVTGETTTASALRSITDTLVNTSNSVQTVIYTITPTSRNGCTGDAYTYTVTIDPQDFVTTDLATHICNNETLNHDLTGDTTVPGTTFSWAAADNANVTGETTTASALRSITDTLVNTSNSVQTVIYTITPTSRNGCTGDAYTYTVTIDPQDFVTTDLATHICNNETLNHDLTGDTTVPGTTFSWAAADNANVTGETTTASALRSITDTLVNTSNSVQTVIYTITPTSRNGCTGDAYTYTVTIDPQDFVTTDLATHICNNETLNHDLTGDTTVPGTTFSWAAADNANVTGETTTASALRSITDTLVNTSNSVQTVIYTITPTSRNGCTGDAYTYTVTIDPQDFVTTDLATHICNNETLNHDLTGDTTVPGTTFSWAAADNANVTGETTTASALRSITDTLVNTSNSVQTVIYTITPTSGNGCTGDAYTYTVTIDPQDFVTTDLATHICNNETLNHDLTGDTTVPGTTFSWAAADNANVTGETTTASALRSITDTLVNTSNSVQTVIYTITPTSRNGCTGDAYTYTVTIDPQDFVTTDLATHICNNETLNHDLTGDTTVPGTTFSWAAADNANVTGETTTASALRSITDTLVNTSNSVQTVIYTITPTSRNGCTGDAYTYTVTIDPQDFVTTDLATHICNNETLNHDLTGDTTVPGTTFSWAAADNANVTGETTTASALRSITDTLVNTSNSVQTVIYTITPTSRNGCTGDAYTYTVTIDPQDFVTTDLATHICNNETLNHDLTGDTTVPGTTFSWAAADNANVTGETTTASALRSITDTLVNTSNSVQTVIYTITPTSRNGCTGDAYTYTVTIDPQDFVTTDLATHICNNETLNHDLTGDTTVPGTTFSWAAADNANVTGETTTASALRSITDTLVNTSNSVQTVIYTITPTSGNGCTGDAYTYTVTIDPQDFVTTDLATHICNNETLNHDLTGDTTVPGTTFSWAAADNANVTGETTTASALRSITDTLVNTSNSVQTVIYTITPTSRNGCTGDAYTYTVTIDPQDFVTTDLATHICNNETLNHDLTGDTTVPGTTFSWAAADNANVTGETTTASALRSITDTLVNTSNSVQTVIYTITPTIRNGCTGDAYTYTVTIDPQDFVTTDLATHICNNETLNHDLTGDTTVPGTTFSWAAADNANVTGETTTASALRSITDTLVNTSNSVQTVIYTITPTSRNGCTGDAYTYTVTIDPQDFVTTDLATHICNNETLNHDLTGDTTVPGTTFSWAAADNANVTGETTTASALRSITDTLVNTSNSVQTVIYTITPTSRNGCTGDAYTYTVTIDPQDFVTTDLATHICNNETLNHDLTGDTTVPGTTFSWAAADNANVTGETTTASALRSITDTLVNTSNSVQTVIYTITPTSGNGCTGDAYTYTVTIDPQDFVTTDLATHICNNETLNHDLTGDTTVPGTTFSWAAADNANVTGETTTASALRSITDTLVNTSNSVQTVIYTITPTSRNGCTGDAYTYTVTIDPQDFVTTDLATHICNNETLNHDLTGDTTVPGTTFSWAAADNANVTGETTTASALRSITDTLVNTSNSVQTVIYTITPTSRNGCTGDAYTYTVTIDPQDFVTTDLATHICNNETLNHDLTGDTTVPGTTFSWAAADNANVTGETTTASALRSITDTLVNTSNSVQTVIYTITPTSRNGCTGDAYTYTVTIDPQDFVTTDLATHICNNETLNHDLTGDTTVPGTTFSWAAADNANVTGETTTASALRSITDTLVNTSNSVQTVIYTITPTSRNGCTGDAYTYTVTIDPQDFVTTDLATHICNNETLNHDLTGDTTVPGTTFSWAAADNANVTGETTTASALRSITDTLVNTSNSVQTVIYTITPTSGNGCTGDAYTYTVTIDPQDFVTTDLATHICNNETLNHDLTGDTTVPGTTFSWAAADNANVTGETTTASALRSITDTLVNTSNSVQTVIYTITPTSRNGCTGDAYTYTVTIDPQDFVTTDLATHICNNETLNHDLTGDTTVPGTTFSWAAADNANVTGETTTASALRSITDTLVNTSNSVQTVIYTITPTSRNGCTGDAYTYTVTIDPQDFVTTDLATHICNNETLNHDLTGDTTVPGTTFSWAAADNANVTGETTTASALRSITDTLVNTSNSVQTVIYTITPTSRNGCTGDAYTYTVTIDPQDFVTTDLATHICNNETLNHDLTGDTTVPGTTFSWAAADNANVTGETTTASALRSITDTLVNTSNSVQTVIYTITPTSRNGCTGDAYTYTVTIDPQDFVTTDLATHICNNETLNHDLTGDTTVPGTTFSWAAADNANVTGETTTASALRSITDTLVNTSNSVQTVIYTITPTSRNGCTGDAYTYTVTIDPQDFVTTDLATHICNNETLNHDLTGDTTVPGTTFSWAAADNANVTGETTTASALRSITDTLVNTSNSVQTVIYTITPTSRNGCTGDAYTYTVTIDPQDFVTTDLATHICNNETLNHDLTGDTTVPGTTFSWAAADNANVTGETTTASALRSITDTLVNTSNSVQTVIYTITPTSGNGCTGDAYTYTVTIDPQDFVTTDLATHICNNETLNHDLTGDTTVPGTTFSWAAADNANVTGETTTASALRSITDTLVNTSNSVQTVIYTITPTSRNGCTGDAYTYTVTIDPQDFVTTDLATHICNNETLNHDLTGDTTVPGTTFSWAAADNANVTGETTTASALRSITDTLVNTSNSVQTVIYTITPTSGNGCTGDAYTYTVTIDPQDFVTTDLATHICNNETLNHDLTGDTTVPGTTFSWAAADNANVTGETTTASALRSITDTLVNTSNSVQTVIYTITPTSRNGCTGDAYTYTVTIDPQDFVTTDLATHICNNETLNHDLTGDTTVPGTTFSWAAADNANVTGETTTASALRSITDTLVNTSNSVQTVIYTITPTSGNGCTGDAYTYTVTIDPQDFVTTDLATHICNNETLNHDLTGDTTVPGTTFSWAAADNANVTGETTTASALRSITDTLVNTSNSVQTVIYTITPTSRNGCTGDAYTYTVTIDPQDFVTTDLATHICNNETLNHDLTGDTTVPGTTFSWAAADNANVTGETTTASALRSITDTLVNTSNSVQTVIYTITPTSRNGCTGDAYTYTVTIDPQDFVTTDLATHICNNETLNHDLTGDTTVPGTTFSWAAADNANVTGETTTASALRSITDTLVNTSNSVQTVIYTITPTSRNGCTGDAYTYTVTIDPQDFVTTDLATHICNNETLNHDLTGDTTVPGTTFSWAAADNANVTGETTTASALRSITDTLVNTSNSVQTVIYTITPTIRNGCTGDAYTYTVTIDPQDFVTTDLATHICNNETLNHDLTGDTTVPGTTFSWAAADNANVTGETTTASALRSITDTLVNTSNSVQTVIYTITPTSRNGCTGDAYTYTVTIDPQDFVTTDLATHICNNETLNHDLTGDTTVPGTTFSWAAADNANVTGETTTASALRSITDTLVNTSNSVQTVIYTITPTSRNGCTGDAYTYTVTIDPQDFVTTDLATHICNNETLNHDLTGDTTVPGTTFSWAAADNANVTGETTTASALRSITDTLVNTSNSVQTVIYTITPTSRNGCTGDAYTYTVTIDPQDFVTTDLATHICNNETLNHDLTGDTTVPGTTFSWAAADNANVTGETTTASALRSITDTLVNTSNSVQTVIYTITPTSRNGCTGDAYTYTVTIDPQDFVTTDLATHICNNETLNHDLTGDTTVPGTTFSWAAADNANVTGETTTASALRSITDTLVNTSNSVQTVIYTITPTSRNGCTGDAYTYTVTIDPQDFVTTDLATHICNNETLNHDLTGDTTVPGTTFSWAAADNANVTGETTTASALRSITDTLVNTSNSVQTVIYTITPTSRNGCTGDAYTYTVTIDPQDFVTTDLATHICNNETLNHDLTGDTTVPGTTFSWAAADNANVTGETTTASALRSITDTLVNTSNSVQTVIYTITPTSGNGCTGDAYTYTVTIDPQDFVTTDLATHICNNETLNHDLTGDTTVPGTTFSWAAADNANVTGETTTASALRSITDTLVNTSNSVQTVIYTITPTSRNGCTGDAYTYTVTIDPQDFVTTDPIITIITGETLNFDLGSSTSVLGATFSWLAIDNLSISGETTFSIETKTVDDTLINTSLTDQIVIYMITPVSPNGCVGKKIILTVNVLADTDGDGIPDIHDLDDDNDGILDSVEQDGDRRRWASRPNRDTDEDGIPNHLDLDSDGDGIFDLVESGQDAAKVDVDGNGVLDSTTDADNDGIIDFADEDDSDITAGGSTDPVDTDGDGTPDFQDTDSDNDGVSDLLEGVSDPSLDTDNNGVIDDQNDIDGDGLADSVDPDNGGIGSDSPDTDGDGLPDYQDLDSDGDGINDVIEAGGVDTNNDGQVDTGDLVDGTNLPDEDSDGTPDVKEPNNPDLPGSLDTDGDGVIDDQTDSDGDGISDLVDGLDGFGYGLAKDSDGDGMPDHLDPDTLPCLTAYNEFTPNGDGANDTFVISCIGEERYKNNRLEIYNRWGVLVYSKNRYDNSWLGESTGRSSIQVKKQLPSGTYYYVLDLGTGSSPRIGWLYINRE